MAAWNICRRVSELSSTHQWFTHTVIRAKTCIVNGWDVKINPTMMVLVDETGEFSMPIWVWDQRITTTGLSAIGIMSRKGLHLTEGTVDAVASFVVNTFCALSIVIWVNCVVSISHNINLDDIRTIHTNIYYNIWHIISRRQGRTK